MDAFSTMARWELLRLFRARGQAPQLFLPSLFIVLCVLVWSVTMPPTWVGSQWSVLALAALPLVLILRLTVDSFAGERERSTLEALLIAPVPDWVLVAGKVVALESYAVLLLGAVLGMHSLGLWLTGQGSVAPAWLGFVFGAGVVTYASIICLGIAVSWSAPSVQAAMQIWLYPVMGVGLVGKAFPRLIRGLSGFARSRWIVADVGVGLVVLGLSVCLVIIAFRREQVLLRHARTVGQGARGGVTAGIRQGRGAGALLGEQRQGIAVTQMDRAAPGEAAAVQCRLEALLHQQPVAAAVLPQPGRGSRVASGVILWPLLLLGLLLLAVFANGTGHDGTPAGSATAPPAVQTARPARPRGLVAPVSRVRVCRMADYSIAQVACLRTAPQLSAADFVSAELSVAGPSDGSMDGATLDLTIGQRRANGSFSILGHATSAGPLAGRVAALNLERLFERAGIQVRPGVHYTLEVTLGRLVLGQTSLTID